MGFEPHIHLLLSRCPTIERLPHGREWLVYPAYPRHSFSLRGLVHICIPHTGTPCGRVLGRWSYSLSWASALRRCHSLAFCTLSIPYFKGFVKRFLTFCERLFQAFLLLLTPLLYHTLWGLSRGFFNFFRASSVGFEPLGSGPSLQPRLTSPPDIIIIPQAKQNVKHFGKNNFFFYFRKNS